MTVKELIKDLQKYPEDMLVFIGETANNLSLIEPEGPYTIEALVVHRKSVWGSKTYEDICASQVLQGTKDATEVLVL